MLTLDANTLIATNSAEITTFYLYDIYYDNEAEPLHWCGWFEDVTFDGHIYESKVIKHSEIRQSSDGKVNTVSLSIGNVDRIIQYYIEQYDLISKKVRIIQFIDGQVGYLENTYVITGAKAKKDVATFSLSIGIDFLKCDLPGRTMRAKFCTWRFGDSNCKYLPQQGEQCDRTWTMCKAKNNILNFGGFPGIINEKFYF